MQFRFYDEVDPEQVNRINLISHNEPADARTISRIRRNDPFCSPWFRMYAMEGDRIAAQVGAQYPIIQTVEGQVKAGFIEAVAAMPKFARKGYATALMKKVHEQMVDDGIDIFMLTTSKVLVAYSMYPKVGYHEVLPLNWAMKERRKAPAGDVQVRVRKHGSEAEDKLFRTFADGSLGFVHRPFNYPKLKCSWREHYSKTVTFFRNGEQIGYALVRRPGGFTVVRELVCPDPEDVGPCIKALENRFPGRYVTRSLVSKGNLARRFRDAGFREEEMWGMFMAMDSRGRMSRKKVTAALGLDKDKFQMFAIDTY